MPKYTVKEGDSPASIAAKFGNARAIQYLDQRLPDLHPGMEIDIPDIDPKKNYYVSDKWIAQTNTRADYNRVPKYMATYEQLQGGARSMDAANAVRWDWKNKNFVYPQYKPAASPVATTPKTPQDQSVASYTPDQQAYMDRINVFSTGDPQKISQELAAGGLNWKDIPIAARQKVFSQPGFDISKLSTDMQQQVLPDWMDYAWKNKMFQGQGGIQELINKPEGKLPWWQVPAFHALSNPLTSPLVQGAVPIAGGVASKNPFLVGLGGAQVVAGYSQLLPQGSPLQKLGMRFAEALMYPSVKVEQTAALGEYGGYNQNVGFKPFIKKNNKTGQMEWDINTPAETLRAGVQTLLPQFSPIFNSMFGSVEFINNMRKEGMNPALILPYELGMWKPKTESEKKLIGVWESGKTYYELKPIREGVAGEAGKTWMLGAADPVQVAAQYTPENYAKRIAAGEDANQVMMDFQTAYGVLGLGSDFALSAIFDPLNVMGEFESAGVKKFAEKTNRPLLAKAASGDSFMGTTHGLFDTIRNYKNIVKDVGHTELASLDGFSKRLAGLTPEGKIKEWMPNEKPSIKNFYNMFNLTPEAKAHLHHTGTIDNVTTLMAMAEGDPLKFSKMFDQVSNSPHEAAAQLGEFVDAPEMYTSLPMMKNFDAGKEAIVDWTLNQGNRDAFNRMAAVLGETPAALFDRLKNADDLNLEYQRLLQKAAESNSPGAKALLEAVQAGEFKPEHLADLVNRLDGKPLTPDQWFANWIYKFDRHAMEYISKLQGVKPEAWYFRTANLLKSIQSKLLLSYNITYPINNLFSNMATMVVDGLLGVQGKNARDGWMQRFGSIPSRLDESNTIIGSDTLRVGDENVTSPGELYLRDQMAPKDLLRNTTDFVRGKGILSNPMGRLSGSIESASSNMAYTKAMQKYWARAAKIGKGYDRLPLAIENSVNQKYPDFTSRLYGAIESSMNAAELDEKVFNNSGEGYVYSLMNSAADELGIDRAEAAEIIQAMGLTDVLDNGLKNAPTTEKKLAVFADAQKQMNDWLDRGVLADSINRVRNITERVQEEGFPAVRDIMDDLLMQRMSRHYDSLDSWDPVWEKIGDGKLSKEALNQLVEANRKTQDASWNRVQDFEAATTLGVLKALGIDDKLSRNVGNEIIKDAKMWRETYAKKAKLWADFWRKNFDTKEQWRAAHDAVLDDVDKLFNDAFQKSRQNSNKIGDAFALAFEQKFGIGSANGVDAWFTRRGDVIDRMGQANREHYAQARTMPFADRMKARLQFKDWYKGLINEMGKADMDGIDTMYDGMGMANVTQTPTRVGATTVANATAPETAAAPVTAAQPVPEQAGLFQTGVAERVATQAAEHEASVWEVASRHGLASADEAGNPTMSQFDIMKEYNKWKGSGPAARTFADIQPDQLDKALTRRDEWAKNQSTLDQAVEQAKADTDAVDNPQPFTPDIQRPPEWDAKVQEAIDGKIVHPEIRARILATPDDFRTPLEKQALETMFTHDQLVGIPNKAAWEQRVAMRQDKPVKVSMDLDFLKWFNDNGGHIAAGDVLLRAFADALKAVSEDDGDAYRFSGDEFGAMFSTPEAAQIAMDKLGEIWHNTEIEFEAVSLDGKPLLDADGKPIAWKGGRLSYGYGTGSTLPEADIALTGAKAKSRIERGSAPAGAASFIRGEDWQPSIRLKGEGENAPAATTKPATAPAPTAGTGTNKPAVLPVQQEVESPALTLLKSKPLSDPGLAELRPHLEQIMGEMLNEAQNQKKDVLQFIRESGGIDMRHAPDASGENKSFLGVFTKRGVSIDEMARRLEEYGYITKGILDNPDDNGGINAVYDLIRSQLDPSQERVYSLLSESKTTKWRELDKRRAQAISNILPNKETGESNENVRWGRKPNATEITVKEDAWNRLADYAETDGRLSDATGFEYSFDRLDEQLATISDNIGFDDPALLRETIDRLMETMPKKTETPDFIWNRFNDIENKLQDIEERKQIAIAQAEIQADVERAQAKGDFLMDRSVFREKVANDLYDEKSSFGLSRDEYADMVTRIVEENARAWGKLLGMDEDAYIARMFKDITQGGGEEGLHQIQPVTRSLTTPEIMDYARALVRAGADELGRALSDEDNKSTRIQILDAAYRINKDVALEAARNNKDLLFQIQEVAPTWYSKLERTVADLPQEKMTVDQLRGAVNKAGVKADELYWTGFDEWLKGQKNVTKAEALDYLRKNGVQLQEVTRGGDYSPEVKKAIESQLALVQEADALRRDARREIINLTNEEPSSLNWEKVKRFGAEELYRKWDEARQVHADRVATYDNLTKRGEDVTTKYSQYTEPGGTNYREVELTLPRETGRKLSWEEFRANRQHLTEDGAQYAYQAYVNGFDTPKEVQSKWFDSYQSPHWPEKNVLAHMRLDDRIDAQGRKILFVEEVQSDWHQAGREKGYNTGGDYRVAPQDNYPGFWAIYDKEGNLVSGGYGYEDTATTQMKILNGKNRVPPAPFSKTWPELVMKRVLRMAAEEGYDGVAWTTGAQQAARYDLSKQVDSIQWLKYSNDETIRLNGRKDGNSLFIYDIPKDRLEHYVGKDAAKTISSDPKMGGELSGEGLKVGGEGMKTFYDEMLPSWANKYAKKWGVEVGETRIETRDIPYAVKVPEGWEVRSPQTGSRIDMFKTEAEAEAYINKEMSGVNFLPVNDAMRKSVMEGQPLFQTKRRAPAGATTFDADGKAIIHALQAKDLTTAVHEIGHVLRRNMYRMAEETGNERLVADIAEVERYVNSEVTRLNGDGKLRQTVVGKGQLEAIVDGKWSKGHEEIFARAFERYLADGVAPTPGLMRVFEAFKRIMLGVYRSLTGTAIDMRLSDEVRGVFDRMLGGGEGYEGRPAQPAPVAPAGVSPLANTNYRVTIKRTDNTSKITFESQPPKEVSDYLSGIGMKETQLGGLEWIGDEPQGRVAKGYMDRLEKPAQQPHVNPYSPTVRTDLPNQPMQTEAPAAPVSPSGMLPGMEQVPNKTGQMTLTDLQPGTEGSITPMDAPYASTIMDIEPGKTVKDAEGRSLNSGDIVVDKGGNKYTVKGANRDGRLITEASKPIDPAGVRKIAAQETMFSGIQTPEKGLTDFGEKIGGAKKDLAAVAAEERRAISDEDIIKLPLSEIWPKADVDNITDIDLAAFGTTLRELLPAKPRDSYKLRRWAEKVKIVRGLMDNAASMGVDEVLANAKPVRELADWVNKTNMLRKVPREHWKRIGDVRNYPDAYHYDADGKKVSSAYAYAEIDGKHIETDTFDALIQKVQETLNVEKQAAQPAMKFEVRGNGKVFSINKAGDPLYRKLKTFGSSKEAFDYIHNNRTDLVTAWDAVKEAQNVKETDVRRAENMPRVGKDWAGGKDVTPQMFLDDFGFRGVEFGNWVSQGGSLKERQGMLNAAYDALMDLSEITGVPPRALSLNGALGLGFGSRGSGKASAHYEPGKVVINLTKTRGAGALAHEWFHALDNYFQKARGKGNSGRTEGYITFSPETRYVNTVSGELLSATHFENVKKRGGLKNPDDWKLQQGVRPEVEFEVR